jgi:hypothetical protein
MEIDYRLIEFATVDELRQKARSILQVLLPVSDNALRRSLLDAFAERVVGPGMWDVRDGETPDWRTTMRRVKEAGDWLKEEMVASLDIEHLDDTAAALKNELAIVDREVRQSLLYCLAQARSNGLV